MQKWEPWKLPSDCCKTRRKGNIIQRDFWKGKYNPGKETISFYSFLLSGGSIWEGIEFFSGRTKVNKAGVGVRLKFNLTILKYFHFRCETLEYLARGDQRGLFQPNYWYILKSSQTGRKFDTCVFLWSKLTYLSHNILLYHTTLP